MIDMSQNFWSRKGLLVQPSAGLDNYTHASHPCILHIEDDNYLLIFSMRNLKKRSHIFSVHCLVRDGQITLNGSPKLVLSPGKMGTFDCEGLLSCCAVRIDQESAYFYYSGWNNFAEGLWLCDTGLAKIDIKNNQFNRLYDGPIMSRSRHNPYFAAGTSILKEGAIYKSWYNSGLEWYKNDSEQWIARYGVHYAESRDGVDWNFKPGLIIPFKDSQEHSFGRPTVIKQADTYHMWFSCRGSYGNSQYRIGYAFSDDGISWSRNDELSGINISHNPEDFDSIAQSYPYPFEHKDTLYMLYNGNNYGATGVGYSVLESLK
jgi:hypothetical protein